MPDSARISIRHESDVLRARQEGRKLASEVGFSGSDLAVIATAISEIARNVIQYAKTGEMTIATLAENGTRGVLVVVNDEGPGIADLERAMQDGYSTGGGLGLGLPGAKRLMDEFEIASAPGDGTVIRMKKWKH